MKGKLAPLPPTRCCGNRGIWDGACPPLAPKKGTGTVPLTQLDTSKQNTGTEPVPFFGYPAL